MKKIFIALLIITISTLPTTAQEINISLGDGSDGTVTGRIIQLVIIITILSLAPSIVLMTTSFTRLVIVFSLVRTALGTQGAPPNSVLIGLAMFLTLFIMQPTLEKAYNDGLNPLIQGQISEEDALPIMAAPFHDFMLRHAREADVQLFMRIAQIEQITTPQDTPFRVLIPAFMISELKRAFEIGFLLFVPFLIIDMVVASVLMSMGMMMLPPIIVSMPFKLIFFVIVDGWYILAGSLVQSFNI